MYIQGEAIDYSEFLPKPCYEAEFRFANLFTVNDKLNVTEAALYHTMGAGLANTPPLLDNGYW